MESMGNLKKKGMQKLILDLRGNGGGLLKEAIAIADEFLSGDKLIVYTEGDHQQRVDNRCRRDGIFEVGKLVVLVDEGSASASEVLAGALQDWDRATIIGRRTFGKGLVQQQFQLSDGSAVRLTIARYYTPLGRNIQKPKGKAFKTPSGKLVYDGGGISPDIFIPLDTANISDNVMRLYYRNSLSSFVYRYYLQNRTRFDLITKPENILTDFQPGEKELMELRSFALSHDGVIINSFTEKEKTQISQRLQTLMAKQLWRMEGYFEIANRYDAAVQKGIISLK
jgi:carboxyl-terminal processing protease